MYNQKNGRNNNNKHTCASTRGSIEKLGPLLFWHIYSESEAQELLARSVTPVDETTPPGSATYQNPTTNATTPLHGTTQHLRIAQTQKPPEI